MDNNKNNGPQIELSAEVAAGVYSNLAMMSHTPGEFFIDFMTAAPGMPHPRVLSRVVMNPENAKNLLFALQDNIRKYEAVFGEIQRKVPVNQAPAGNGEGNPFMA